MTSSRQFFGIGDAMLPRISVRRCFLYSSAICLSLIVVVNLTPGPPASLTVLLPQSDQSASGSSNLFNAIQSNNKHQPQRNQHHSDNVAFQKTQRKPAQEQRLDTADWKAELPWFMTGGRRRPGPAPRDPETGRRMARLWPDEVPNHDNDRIVDQLMFVPPIPLPRAEEDHPENANDEIEGDEAGERNQQPPQPTLQGKIKLKRIVLYNGLGGWGVKEGRSAFSQCPVNTCTVSGGAKNAPRADLLIFKDHYPNVKHHRPMGQVWMLYYLECPYHTQRVAVNDVFNWTATYRADSDIVAPYERWVYYDPNMRVHPSHGERNYAANKTKKVAWFVSNCAAKNQRLQYAYALQRHIPVDIYGSCGPFACPRSNGRECFRKLDTEYKFYLAFENSNCRDYITEKLYVNGLGHDVVPIVMGAHPDDYARAAPEGSYIHVDDFESPKALAEYLHQLDKDDDAYNAYFRWKGTGEFINTHFFCRVCAMLHDATAPAKAYRDINAWWRGKGVCTKGSWREQNKPATEVEFDQD